MEYLKRLVDAEIEQSLRALGAVLIEGPRASGKTVSARQFARSEVNVDLRTDIEVLLANDPKRLLSGDTPRLFDEWQLVPELWNHIRHEVDERPDPGQFILTGSSSPDDDVRRHSGAGRFARVEMSTMTLFESGESSGEVSLSALGKGEPPSAGPTELAFDELVERICGSGFPAARKLDRSERQGYVDEYMDQLSHLDVRSVDGKRMDPRRVAALIRSLARNVSTEAGIATMARDSVVDDQALGRDTAVAYVDALMRTFAMYEQPAWGAHLRSRARLRTSPKRHLADPAMAVSALGASPEKLIADPNLFGLLFESQVIHDLRAYGSPFRAEVCHYRDSNGLEVDAIVSTASSWGAIEVKLGRNAVDGAAETLKHFAATVDTDKMGEPSYLAVVIPSGYAYRREDGVDVIPLTTLGP